MADSYVQINEGSGKKMDSRTEASNSEHRQVVVVGDPSVNAGVAPVGAVNGLAVHEVADSHKTVAAGSTAQVLGATGAIGDYLARIIIVPESTTPGAVVLFDGSSSPDVGLTIFTGGSVTDFRPIELTFGVPSANGAWKVTTGSNVHCLCIGTFT